MFKDLKEYQEITKIYHDSVNISEEQREINKIFVEQEFTAEEIQYLDENFDEIITLVSKDILEENQELSEETISEEDLHEVIGKLIKAAAKSKLGQKVMKSGGKNIVQGAKNIAKGAKELGGKVLSKAKGFVKKAAPIALAGGLGAGAVKVAQAIGNRSKKNKETIKKAKDAELDKKIKQGIKDSGMGDKGTAITQKGKEQAAYNRGERAAREKLGDPTLNSNVKKKEPPKATETEAKPKKMHPIEKKNRARLGDAKVDALKAKNADFKLMRKGTMSKDDFIKKYPKSITAQKSKGLRDHTEWDAYDMVLEYLYSTEQVSSLEEANYVMMEMEQQTIGEIVKEVKEALIDEGLAKMALKTGAVIGGALLAKKGVGDMKKKFDNYLNNQRDKGIGGNTRPGSDKMYYGK